MLSQENTKMQGNVGMGRCIAFSTMKGYTVSLPLNDSQSYDLIIDDGSLKRVQVKTSRCEGKYGGYRVDLKSSSLYTHKNFDSNSCDILYVLTADGSEYWIPSTEIIVKHQIIVGNDKYSEYKI
jgi:uncharacterized ubiquitin-like protein YukD